VQAQIVGCNRKLNDKPKSIASRKGAVNAVLKRSRKRTIRGETDGLAVAKPMADAHCMCKSKQQVEIVRRNRTSKNANRNRSQGEKEMLAGVAKGRLKA
jgi:hypothetical protein